MGGSATSKEFEHSRTGDSKVTKGSTSLRGRGFESARLTNSLRYESHEQQQNVRYPSRARWAEENLRDAEADVLTFMDCINTRGESKIPRTTELGSPMARLPGTSESLKEPTGAATGTTHCYELLCGARADEREPSRTRPTYTSALIIALQAYLDRPSHETDRFLTSFELHGSMKQLLDSSASPQLFQREASSPRHIQLQELAKVPKH
jgi:hypothetical protein